MRSRGEEASLRRCIRDQIPGAGLPAARPERRLWIQGLALALALHAGGVLLWRETRGRDVAGTPGAPILVSLIAARVPAGEGDGGAGGGGRAAGPGLAGPARPGPLPGGRSLRGLLEPAAPLLPPVSSPVPVNLEPRPHGVSTRSDTAAGLPDLPASDLGAWPGGGDGAPGPGLGTGTGSGRRWGAGAGSGEGLREAPEAVHVEQPRYPATARRARIEGTVWVRIAIDARGHVIGAEAEEDTPSGVPGEAGKDLREAAVEAARRWIFRPVREGNRPVEARFRMPFRFTLGGS